MALSANREVDRYVDQELRRYGVAAGARVFKGGFVGLNPAGYARPLVAGDRCVGVAYEATDNANGANGAVAVRVFTQGDFEHALTGASTVDIGKPVYASADDTLTLAAAGGSRVGTLIALASAGNGVVRLAVEPVAGPVPPLSSAAVELDCRADGSPSEAVLIPAALNTGGMVVAECFGIVTEVLAGATEDLAVITFKDTDNNPLNIMLTSSDNGADAVNDILVPSGTTVTLWAGSTGAPAAVVPAGKGIKAVVTQATSGTGAAGRVKVLVKAVSLGG